VASDTINGLLDQLEASKSRFGSREQKNIEKLLARAARRKFTQAKDLIRFHEILLFLRAYPHNSKILKQAEDFLSSFGQRVAELRDAGADLSPLDAPEVSGIAGTAVTDTFSYEIVRWLLKRHPTQLSLDWEWFEDENRLAATWPRFLPLLEEDAFVEANVPYLEWLHAARDKTGKDLPWLIERFESLTISDREQAELYEAQNLYVRWTPAGRATRTGMRLPVPNIFYHRRPLMQRKDISLLKEVQAPPPPLKRLSQTQGEAILDMARETSTVRYRELHGFTHGDPARVLKASIGRGVEVFIMGVPPERRLPLRAYHAAIIFKNGVPVGYFEGLSLFERMESGFNFYYSFREGETAWIYARTLNIFHHLLGVTAFLIDPYQIGYKNEEGIESGAFWFYRKLGFRPTRPKLLRIALNEERKIAARPLYRTPARVLRQLAEGHMILEIPSSTAGDWDRFQVRNIGLAIQRRMAASYGGEAERIRDESVKRVKQVLGVKRDLRPQHKLRALADLSLVIALIPDLNRWSDSEKQDIVRIIRAKAAADEARYLKLLQKHARLRSAMIKLGS
jgi:hypothetical protein